MGVLSAPHDSTRGLLYWTLSEAPTLPMTRCHQRLWFQKLTVKHFPAGIHLLLPSALSFSFPSLLPVMLWSLIPSPLLLSIHPSYRNQFLIPVFSDIPSKHQILMDTVNCTAAFLLNSTAGRMAHPNVAGIVLCSPSLEFSSIFFLTFSQINITIPSFRLGSVGLLLPWL